MAMEERRTWEKMVRLARSLIVWLSLAFSSAAGAAPYDDSLNGAVASLAASLSRSNVATVAVADFADLGGDVSEIGRFVAEEISSRLVGQGKFRVVDRAALMQLLKRENKNAADLDDPVVQDTIARTLNVSALIKGSLIMVGGAFRLNMKVIDTSSRSMIGTVLVEIPATESLTAMQRPAQAVGNAARPPRDALPASVGTPTVAAVRAKPVDVRVGWGTSLRVEVTAAENTDCCSVLTLTITPLRHSGTGATSAKVVLFNPKVAAYLVDARGEQKPFRAARGMPVVDSHDPYRMVRTADLAGREIPFQVNARLSLEFGSRIDFTQKTDLTFKLLYTDSSPGQLAHVEEVVAVIRSIAFDQ